jgi:hypothetical protein
MGAVIGGLGLFLASWLNQRMRGHSWWNVQEGRARQDLYKEFIEEATKCYLDALQHDKGDIPSLVTLYTKIERMRIVSSPKVSNSADQIARKIIDTYLQPNKTFLEFREMVNSNSIDVLRDFTEACREESESLRA